MKKFISLLFALIGLVGAVQATHVTTYGPVTLFLDVKSGVPCYSILYNNQPVIIDSKLGLVTNIGDFSKNLTMKDPEVKEIEGEYELRNIKKSHVTYNALEVVAQYEQNGQHVMDITFRVSKSYVAFRYTLLPKKNRRDETLCCIIQEEHTAFQLAEATSFLAPQSKPMTGFARTAPSYETRYGIDEPTGKNGWGNGYTFPCLFKIKAQEPAPAKGKKASKKTQPVEDTWVMISETGTDGNYVGCRLLGEADGLYRIGFPQAEEGNGWGPTTVAMV